MITYKNYNKTIQSKGLKKTDVPMTLWKGWDFVDKVSLNGDSWTAYQTSEPIKRTVDLYFSKFEDFLESQKKPTPSTSDDIETIEDVLLASKNVRQKMPRHQQRFLVDEHISVVKKLEKELAAIPKMYSQDGKNNDETVVYAHYFHGQSDWFITEQNTKEDLYYGYTILNGDSQMSEPGSLSISEFVKNGKVELDFHWGKKSLAEALYKADPDYFPAPKINGKKATNKVANNQKKRSSKVEVNSKKVEKISDELKFMKRFVYLHNKAKTRNQIRLFIGALQKSIRERSITKTSKYAKEIMSIQDDLLKLHKGFRNETEKIVVEIADKTRDKYLGILGMVSEMTSVKLIKSFINLQGKIITNKKAQFLLGRINRAVNAKKVTKKDKYWEQIKAILGDLDLFVKKNKGQGMIRIEPQVLNGLAGIVSGCGCKNSLDGFDTIPNDVIMNSMDIVELNFKKLDFKGKWRKFIGNPSKGFSAMIFAKPKMGKSNLSIQWAGYLARNHGTVLYVAKEEGIDDTLQDKLISMGAAHPDLYGVGSLPDNLSNYDFVFLDSITKLGLTPSDLSQLESKYPNTSFIAIFQVTKSGEFRGNNGFQHDVDVVIEIPEKGKAIQYGRFNQGGEMDVFDDMRE